jgi:hypothetical protein
LSNKQGLLFAKRPTQPKAKNMATKTATTKRDTVAMLLERRNKIDQRLAEIERRKNGTARKNDTRVKILLGAATMNDVEVHPETRGAEIAKLHRAITKERDIEFLTNQGWW